MISDQVHLSGTRRSNLCYTCTKCTDIIAIDLHTHTPMWMCVFFVYIDEYDVMYIEEPINPQKVEKSWETLNFDIWMGEVANEF